MGSMVTGWEFQDRMKYYMDNDGSAITGWKQLDNQWYHFNSNGIMSSGWVSSDGSWYYLDTQRCDAIRIGGRKGFQILFKHLLR